MPGSFYPGSVAPGQHGPLSGAANVYVMEARPGVYAAVGFAATIIAPARAQTRKVLPFLRQKRVGPPVQPVPWRWRRVQPRVYRPAVVSAIVEGVTATRVSVRRRYHYCGSVEVEVWDDAELEMLEVVQLVEFLEEVGLLN